jgi:hypothetical protein
VSRAKAQGTAFETWVVNWLKAIGQINPRRLAEGGSNDEGDVRFDTHFEGSWTIECKSAERLNVTRVLSKARAKSPEPQQTVLFWKRLVKSDGKRRKPDGEPIVVCMGIDTFERLIRHPDD